MQTITSRGWALLISLAVFAVLLGGVYALVVAANSPPASAAAEPESTQTEVARMRQEINGLRREILDLQAKTRAMDKRLSEVQTSLEPRLLPLDNELAKR